MPIAPFTPDFLFSSLILGKSASNLVPKPSYKLGTLLKPLGNTITLASYSPSSTAGQHSTSASDGRSEHLSISFFILSHIAKICSLTPFSSTSIHTVYRELIASANDAVNSAPPLSGSGDRW